MAIEHDFSAPCLSSADRRPTGTAVDATTAPAYRGSSPALAEFAGVPGSEYPRCRSWGYSMTFYGQLNSIGDDFALPDVGVVRVLVCFDCFDAAARVASTSAAAAIA
jgi:hypothetical protein